MSEFTNKITIAFSGASGAPYGLRLVEQLVAANYQIYLLISGAAQVVFATESDVKIPSSPQKPASFLSHTTMPNQSK